uniref:ANK_REP_REGION domain-containing protein n=1 Tax=Panagrolaimus sp. PS1159 TaxID=55785 RepID=A0AC35FM37_9BILA
MGRIAEHPISPSPINNKTSIDHYSGDQAGSSDTTLKPRYYLSNNAVLPGMTSPITPSTISTSISASADTTIDLGASSTECCSCAFRAVKAGHFNCLKNMSKNLLTQVDIEQRSMLHLAVKHGNISIIDYLLQEAPQLADFESNLKETPLLIAAATGRLDIVEKLLRGTLRICLQRALHRDINGTSCLMAAVARSDNETALWLLRRFGRQLAMLPNNCQMLPIHAAAANGNLEFIRIVTKYDPRMVNFKDQFGLSPCAHACQNGSLQCLRYLIEKANADISSLTTKGQSLLHIASLSGHVPIVRWLIYRTGSDAILWPTYDRANAIHCAAFGGQVNVVKILLDLWPKKRRRAILTTTDSRGNTPLHLAVISNQLEMVKYLLEIGSNSKLLNTTGQTAEQIAQVRGYSAVAHSISSYSNGKKLKKGKKFSRSCTDLVHATSPTIYSNSNKEYSNAYTDTTLPGHGRNDTFDSSSGFLSGGEEFLENEPPPKKAEMSTQTDPSHFQAANSKVTNTEEWHGETLAAVEEIESMFKFLKVLDTRSD